MVSSQGDPHELHAPTTSFLDSNGGRKRKTLAGVAVDAENLDAVDAQVSVEGDTGETIEKKIKKVRRTEILKDVVIFATAATVDAIPQDELAETRARDAREAERRAVGEQSLGSFGFAIGTASKHSDGSGGTGGTAALVPFEPNASCSEEQLAVLKSVEAGLNVFFTGSAGVGKSFLLMEIKRLLDHKQRSYHVTAPTGIAALQVGGKTIHSWTGLQLAQEELGFLVEKILGGVYADTTPSKLPEWFECSFRTIELTKVFRQTDIEFVSVLERFRKGVCLPEDESLITNCGIGLGQMGGIRPTVLFPLKNSVATENRAEFNKLPGKPVVFRANDWSIGAFAELVRKDWVRTLKDIPAPDELRLKVNTQVMLVGVA
ncbi:hypothetical protein RQP46_003532 [Phenoliferia psychrophenolica]